jgi:hypothetical protein
MLDAVLAELPTQIQGEVVWTQDGEGPIYQATLGDESGMTGTLHYAEGQGLDLQVDVSAFPDAERAAAYYEAQSEFSTLEGGAANDRFPEPNIFHLNGRYGSAALIQLDTLVVRLLVPVLTTNLTDPLPNVMRLTLEAVERVQASTS